MSNRRKRRTREHIISDLSVNHVERLILRCGWVARRMNPDYGIDLYMETYNDQGEIENEGVWFQLNDHLDLADPPEMPWAPPTPWRRSVRCGIHPGCSLTTCCAR